MTENKCKSLENLLPITTAKLSHTQLPVHFETFRNELHHEMAKHWPFDTKISNPTNTAPISSKSTVRSSIRDGNKSNLILDDNNILPQTFSQLRSNNLPTTDSPELMKKKGETKARAIPKDSLLSFDENQQENKWNIKVQEGVITYRLPDNLPDSFALHARLQKLMKTNTIYLNDRHFWKTLENRFKNLRKQNFQQNMEHLRQTQQQYEQELISQGILPHTTEQAIRKYVEQQRTENLTNKSNLNNSTHKACLIDNISSTNIENIDELETFESDNVHPYLHEILPDYKFQTETGKELGEKFQNQLHKDQIKIKSIFPKTNRQERIQQELETIKTSEGLYAYANRLAKQRSK